MANPKWTPRTGRYETVIWAGKIAFYFLAVLSLGAAARAVAAPASGALSSFLPWASLRSWIAPPYLFAAVHFIILAIWKLSGQKRTQSRPEWASEETTKQPGNPTMLEPFGPSPPPIHSHSREPSPEVPGEEVPAANRGHFSDPSLTAESVDVPADSSEIGAEETEDEPMEVEWKEETDESPPSATQDELNRRFEDFIKKNHEQIRFPSNRLPAV
ncbi:hypothetical protein ZIOFF_059384 [Zingiber officinale]|uniref:DUF4408 domain-containing protein n=1 Tax=Zingiber officinale TaxID=94328 RepID=A0A8J5KGC1_ZINOF|nr:hypothetical protein ZIOFF_059384 [Zingiber officinale]